ncbi:MAG: hypothetical protein ACX932_03960 [Gammaproteobacteria bacterium]
MRFIIIFILRLMGLRVIALALIFILTAQVIHLSQKWHFLPKYTVLEAAETRYGTLKALWDSRPHLQKQDNPSSQSFISKLKNTFSLPSQLPSDSEVKHDTMGLTAEKIKQLPLSQVQGQLQGLYVAQEDEAVASQCLISIRGVAITLSIGDMLQPGVVVTQITDEDVVLREHGKFTRMTMAYTQ